MFHLRETNDHCVPPRLTLPLKTFHLNIEQLDRDCFRFLNESLAQNFAKSFIKVAKFSFIAI
jgi:hypothetical protein